MYQHTFPTMYSRIAREANAPNTSTHIIRLTAYHIKCKTTPSLHTLIKTAHTVVTGCTFQRISLSKPYTQKEWATRHENITPYTNIVLRTSSSGMCICTCIHVISMRTYRHGPVLYANVIMLQLHMMLPLQNSLRNGYFHVLFWHQSVTLGDSFKV